MTSRAVLLCVLLSCACLVCSLRSASAVAAHGPLVVVVGLSFPADDIPYADLRSAFGGQPVKFRGLPLIPINHPLESRLRVLFDEVLLGLSPANVGAFWVDMRIRDQGSAPRTASTPELAIRIVAVLKGAITYADPSSVSGNLKMLTIDGKSVSQHGYPLRR
jgi:hypothetical protein